MSPFQAGCKAGHLCPWFDIPAENQASVCTPRAAAPPCPPRTVGGPRLVFMRFLQPPERRRAARTSP